MDFSLHDKTFETEEEYGLLFRELISMDQVRYRTCYFEHPYCEVNKFFEAIDLESILSSTTRVLEAGCGEGKILESLKKRFGIIANGVDIADFTNQVPEDIFFNRGNIQALPYPDESFDFVYSFMTMMYLPDKLKGVSEIHRVLKTGGIAFLDIQGDGKEEVDIRPPIDDIVKLFPNKGVRVKRFKDSFDRMKQGIYIKKKDTKAVVFPELINARAGSRHTGFGSWGIISLYDCIVEVLEKSDSGTAGFSLFDVYSSLKYWASKGKPEKLVPFYNALLGYLKRTEKSKDPVTDAKMLILNSLIYVPERVSTIKAFSGEMKDLASKVDYLKSNPNHLTNLYLPFIEKL